MDFIKHRKIFYWITGIISAACVAALLIWGLNFGIDFTGGSVIEISYGKETVERTEIVSALEQIDHRGASVRETKTSDGGQGVTYIIRTRELAGQDRQIFVSALERLGRGDMEIIRFNAIGPILGNESARKAAYSIVFVIIAIIIFITFAFRKVSKPISSWKYGVIAIVALIHDMLIPTGVFAALGQFTGAEVDTLFVTALLVILGFSVHDTIVVFDRVRENLAKNEENNIKRDFSEVVNDGIKQTMMRSINTSVTTLLALAALYFFGPEATKHFTLVLMIGIAAGTYSSIFLASPLLVTAEKLQNKINKSKVN